MLELSSFVSNATSYPGAISLMPRIIVSLTESKSTHRYFFSFRFSFSIKGSYKHDTPDQLKENLIVYFRILYCMYRSHML